MGPTVADVTQTGLNLGFRDVLAEARAQARALRNTMGEAGPTSRVPGSWLQASSGPAYDSYHRKISAERVKKKVVRSVLRVQLCVSPGMSGSLVQEKVW